MPTGHAAETHGGDKRMSGFCGTGNTACALIRYDVQVLNVRSNADA